MALDVGIIGAGTAGAASAVFLARAGHKVTVYERVAEPGPAGAGIVLQPSGMWSLAKLGMLDEVAVRGARIERLSCVTSWGRKVIDLAYSSLDPAWYGVGLHRGVLFEALHEAMAGEARITLRTGVEVEDLGTGSAPGRRTLLADDGEVLGEHELVVVADGARSHLRDDTSVTKSVRAYPWGALWFVAEDPAEDIAGELHQVVEGPRRMLGLLPTGFGPHGWTPLVSLFFSVRADQVEAWREAGIDAFHDECARLCPRAAVFLDQIATMDDLTFATYHDVVMSTWNTRSVVYIGDAGHAMSPQLGQGCNLALVDARVLAEHVTADLTSRSLGSALDAYSRARRAHLGFYQAATRLLTPFFQSDWDLLGGIRDAYLGLACKVPWLGREMVRSMCGTKAGWLGGTHDVGALTLPDLSPRA